MTAWYNEVDSFAAQWLRNLITAGHIAPGIVDERPIQEIEAWELVGFTQCHFFAGIGVWSHALRRAGWPDDRPIWTGSCPCQPFSNAGKKKGFSDERHLWPYWQNLITERKPSVIVGEQVASKDGLGWLDLVSADLEGSGYAFGASDLCAAGVGGAHIRQRLYFVGLADTLSTGRPERWSGARSGSTAGMRAVGGVADTAPKLNNGCRIARTARRFEYSKRSAISRLGDTYFTSQHERSSGGKQPLCVERNGSNEETAICDPREIDPRWAHVDWLLCRNPNGEPSWRPVEPGTFPLAHGVASRMGQLRAYGNALDAETAAQFCSVVKEICDGV